MLGLAKSILAKLYYKLGSVHHILVGPMAGMKFKFSDNTGFAALYSGNEKANQRVYAELVRPGDVVIDAGANWGVHALYLAKLVGKEGRVHAFEPHPEVVEELRWHVEANELSQVTIHQCGLFSSTGSINFALGHQAKTSHITQTGQDNTGLRLVEVKSDTLDAVVRSQSIPKIRLIKVDVEGAESELLKGAVETIKRDRPYLVVELHTPEQDLAVAAFLTSLNYKISRLEGPEILHLDRSWPDQNGVWGTILATPK